MNPINLEVIAWHVDSSVNEIWVGCSCITSKLDFDWNHKEASVNNHIMAKDLGCYLIENVIIPIVEILVNPSQPVQTHISQCCG